MNPAGGAKLGYSARAGVTRPEARPVGTGKAVGSTPTIGSTSSFTSRIDVPPDDRSGPAVMGYRDHCRDAASRRSGAGLRPAPWHFFVLTSRRLVGHHNDCCSLAARAGRRGLSIWHRGLRSEAGSNSAQPRHTFRPGPPRCTRRTHRDREDHRACDGPETVGYLLPQTRAHGQDFVRHLDRETEEVRAGGIRVIWTQRWQVRLLLLGSAGHSSAAEH